MVRLIVDKGDLWIPLGGNSFAIGATEWGTWDGHSGLHHRCEDSQLNLKRNRIGVGFSCPGDLRRKGDFFDKGDFEMPTKPKGFEAKTLREYIEKATELRARWNASKEAVDVRGFGGIPRRNGD